MTVQCRNYVYVVKLQKILYHTTNQYGIGNRRLIRGSLALKSYGTIIKYKSIIGRTRHVPTRKCMNNNVADNDKNKRKEEGTFAVLHAQSRLITGPVYL